MTFVRLIAADLVEKRLWPLAALLAGAVVAAPVAIQLTAARTASQRLSHPTPGVVANPLSPGLRDLIRGGSGDQPRTVAGAQLHDPFAGATAAAAPGAGTAAAGVAGAKASGVGTPGPTSASGAGAGAGASAPKPGLGSATTNASRTASSNRAAPAGSGQRRVTRRRTTPLRLGPRGVYRVSIAFGQAASLSTRGDPRRLTLLPSAHDPAVMFLGVLQGGRKAVFLVSSQVKPTGDGTSLRCASTGCHFLFLGPGDTEFLDIHTVAGPLVQYELDLNSISVRRVRTVAQAQKARRREDTQGHALVHAPEADGSTAPTSGATKPGTLLTKLTYSPKLGVVVPHRIVVKSAAAPAASAAAPAPVPARAPTSAPPVRSAQPPVPSPNHN